MRAAILALVLVAACDYTRPPPVGGDDDDDGISTTDADPGDGAPIDGVPIDGIPDDGTPAIDARVDAPVDAAIDGPPIDGPGTVSISLSPPSTNTTLGTTLHLMATITSNGYAGNVTLNAFGGPADWEYTFPPSISLTVGEVEVVTVDLTIDSNGSAATGGTNVTVSAAATGQSAVGDTSNITVANEYVIQMGNGVGAGTHWTGVPFILNLRNGTTLRIVNNDTVSHQIHTGGGIVGLPHQAAAMAPGGSYVGTIGSTGTDTIYCHIHSPSSGMFGIGVQ